MRLLVTGGCGFIASHVVLRLIKKHYIVNIDKLDYCSSLKHLDSLSNNPEYKFIQGNILSLPLLRYIFEREKIEGVLHFAASTHVDNSFDNSLDFTTNNVLGTHNLLACAKEFKIKLFVHVSTDEVKGESDHFDDSIYAPTNPYAASKAGAELLAISYATSFGLPVIITRGNNVYGPYQYPEKIIPKFIFNILGREKCIIHGSGLNQRNYIYVEDVADAFEVILEKGEIGMIYNIASEDCLTNLEVFSSICKELNVKEQDYISFGPDRPFNDKKYVIDGSKLIELGWKQKTSWKDGLTKTVEWYKSRSSVWVGK